MYSVFLPFGAVVIDLFLVFMYFKHDFWLLGGATAIFALFPLLVTTFLLYSRWTRLKLVSSRTMITDRTLHLLAAAGNNIHRIPAVRLSAAVADHPPHPVLG